MRCCYSWSLQPIGPNEAWINFHLHLIFVLVHWRKKMGFLCLWSTPHRTPLSFEFDASKFVSPVSRKTNLDTNDFDSTVYLHTPSRSRITKRQNDRLIQIDLSTQNSIICSLFTLDRHKVRIMRDTKDVSCGCEIKTGHHNDSWHHNISYTYGLTTVGGITLDTHSP